MEIRINEKLRQLRKDKGNTQEQLAMHLGISRQSVEKWERGEGYPDIILLPAIASYYNVSVDDLLGVSEIEKQEKLKEYFKKADECSSSGEIEKEHEIWLQAEKEFPENLKVAQNVMYSYRAMDDYETAIKYAQRILDKSYNNIIRGSAIQVFVYSYIDLGNPEKAKEYANMNNSYIVSNNELMRHILKGEEGAYINHR